MAELPQNNKNLAQELREIAASAKPDKDQHAVDTLYPVILKTLKDAAKQGLSEYNVGCLRCRYSASEAVESPLGFDRVVVSDEVEKELQRVLRADGFHVSFYGCDKVPWGHAGWNTFMMVSWW